MCCNNAYLQKRQIVHQIVVNAQLNHISSYMVTALSRESPYFHERFAYWYFLEELRGKLFTISGAVDLYIPIRDGNIPYYLVCEEKSGTTSYLSACVRTFLKFYPTYVQKTMLKQYVQNFEIILFYPETNMI